MKKRLFEKQGFTLIEILIATSLSVVIITAGFYLLSSHTKLSSQINKKVAEQQISSNIIDIITKDIQNAQSVSSSSTTTKLILNYPAGIMAYEYKNGKVKRKNRYLTDAGDVSSLAFKYQGKLVEIKLDNYTTKALCRN
ncbi:MAG: prepilin-type N-terminal cleavage/methylation domain-containing protein [Candidatus Saganbacteria bacterium]|nr:prepilin-type N-terminal cleavage/methylation domain-containing protein [Candidatus Saganbacteria bacterium]